MAKLVLGTNKQTVVPAVVRDMSPAHYIEKKAVNGVLKNSANIINLNSITDFGSYALAYAYAEAAFPVNTKLDFSNITTITGNSALYYAFYYSLGIVEVDFSSLVDIIGSNGCASAFFGCSELTVVKLSSLKTINGNGACNSMFNGCSGLISVDLSSVETVGVAGSLNNMFQNCYELTSVNLNGLNNIKQLSAQFAYMFNGCRHLESVTFGGLKASTFASAVNQLAYLFNNTTGSQATNGCTVHFPSNFDPSDPNHTFDASTLTGYPTFGGSASYIHVAFDLPATE